MVDMKNAYHGFLFIRTFPLYLFSFYFSIKKEAFLY